MLKFAAPFDMHSLGQTNLLCHDALGFVHVAHDVASAYIERDVVQQPSVLALNHRGAFHDLHRGDRFERDEDFSLGRVQRRGVVVFIGRRLAGIRRCGFAHRWRSLSRRVPLMAAAPLAPALLDMPPALTSSRRMLSSSSRLTRAYRIRTGMRSRFSTVYVTARPASATSISF